MAQTHTAKTRPTKPQTRAVTARHSQPSRRAATGTEARQASKAALADPPASPVLKPTTGARGRNRAQAAELPRTKAPGQTAADLADPVVPAAAPAQATRRGTAKQADPQPRPSEVAPTPVSVPPKASKQARIIDLLRRPEGATITQLMAETGWLSHSVRGVLSGVLKRKLGLAVENRVEPERGRVYRVGAAAGSAPAAGDLNPSPRGRATTGRRRPASVVSATAG